MLDSSRKYFLDEIWLPSLDMSKLISRKKLRILPRTCRCHSCVLPNLYIPSTLNINLILHCGIHNCICSKMLNQGLNDEGKNQKRIVMSSFWKKKKTLFNKGLFQAYTLPLMLNCIFVRQFKFHIWTLKQF